MADAANLIEYKRKSETLTMAQLQLFINLTSRVNPTYLYEYFSMNVGDMPLPQLIYGAKPFFDMIVSDEDNYEFYKVIAEKFYNLKFAKLQDINEIVRAGFIISRAPTSITQIAQGVINYSGIGHLLPVTEAGDPIDEGDGEKGEHDEVKVGGVTMSLVEPPSTVPEPMDVDSSLPFATGMDEDPIPVPTSVTGVTKKAKTDIRHTVKRLEETKDTKISEAAKLCAEINRLKEKSPAVYQSVCDLISDLQSEIGVLQPTVDRLNTAIARFKPIDIDTSRLQTFSLDRIDIEPAVKHSIKPLEDSESELSKSVGGIIQKTLSITQLANSVTIPGPTKAMLTIQSERLADIIGPALDLLPKSLKPATTEASTSIRDTDLRVMTMSKETPTTISPVVKQVTSSIVKVTIADLKATMPPETKLSMQTIEANVVKPFIDAEKAQIKKELEELRAEAKTSKNIIEGVKNALFKLLSKSSTKGIQFEQDYDQVVDTIKTEIALLKRQVGEVQFLTDKASKLEQEAMGDAAKLRKQIELSNQEKESLIRRLEASKELVKFYQTQIQEQTALNADQLRMMAGQAANIEAHGSPDERSAAYSARIHAKMAELTRAFDMNIADIEVNEHTTSLQMLSSKIRTDVERITVLQANSAASETVLHDTQTRLRTAEARLALFEHFKNMDDNTIRQKLQQLIQANAELEGYKTAESTYQMQIAKLGSELRMKTTELDNLTSRATASQFEVEAKQKEGIELTRQISDLKKTIADFEQKNEQLTTVISKGTLAMGHILGTEVTNLTPAIFEAVSSAVLTARAQQHDAEQALIRIKNDKDQLETVRDGVTKQLTELSASYHLLKTKFTASEEEIKTLQTRVTDLEIRKKALEEETQRLTDKATEDYDKFVDANRSRINAEQRYKRIETEKISLENRNRELNNELDQTNKRIYELQVKMEDAEADYKEKLATSTRVINAATERMSEYQAKAQTSDDQLTEVRQKVAQMSIDYDQMSAALTMSQVDVNNLTGQLSVAAGRITALESQVGEMVSPETLGIVQQQLGQERATNASLRTQIEELQKKSNQLSATISKTNTNTTIMDAAGDVKRLKQEITALKVDKTNSSSRITELEGTISALKTQIAKQETREHDMSETLSLTGINFWEELEEKVQASQRDIESYKKKLAAAQKQLSDSVPKLGDLQSSTQEISLLNKQLQTNLTIMTGDRDRLATALNETETKLVAANQKLNDGLAQITKLTTQAKEDADKLKFLASECEKYKASDTLTNELAAARKEFSDATAELMREKVELASIKAKLTTAEASIRTLESTLQTERADHLSELRTQRDKYTKELEASNDRINTMSTELNSLRIDNLQKNGMISMAEKDKDKLKATIIQLQRTQTEEQAKNADFEDHQAEINELNTQIAAKDAEIAKLTLEVAQYNNTIAQYDLEIQELQTQNASAKQFIDQKTAEIASINEQNAIITQAFAEAKQKQEELDAYKQSEYRNLSSADIEDELLKQDDRNLEILAMKTQLSQKMAEIAIMTAQIENYKSQLDPKEEAVNMHEEKVISTGATAKQATLYVMRTSSKLKATAEELSRMVSTDDQSKLIQLIAQYSDIDPNTIVSAFQPTGYATVQVTGIKAPMAILKTSTLGVLHSLNLYNLVDCSPSFKQTVDVYLKINALPADVLKSAGVVRPITIAETPVDAKTIYESTVVDMEYEEVEELEEDINPEVISAAETEYFAPEKRESGGITRGVDSLVNDLHKLPKIRTNPVPHDVLVEMAKNINYQELPKTTQKKISEIFVAASLGYMASIGEIVEKNVQAQTAEQLGHKTDYTTLVERFDTNPVMAPLISVTS